MKKEIFLNTYINNFTMKDALTEIDKLIQTKKKSYVVAINVDVVVKMEDDLYLKKITDEADLVLVDGKPLIWISQYFKNPIKKKKYQGLI